MSEDKVNNPLASLALNYRGGLDWFILKLKEGEI